MATLLLVLQIFIIVIMVLAILLQKTSTDGLSGLSGGGSGVVSQRASSNFFTKLTTVLACAFMINSLALAKMESVRTLKEKGLLEQILKEGKEAGAAALESLSPAEEESKSMEAPAAE